MTIEEINFELQALQKTHLIGHPSRFHPATKNAQHPATYRGEYPATFVG